MKLILFARAVVAPAAPSLAETTDGGTPAVTRRVTGSGSVEPR